MVCNFEGNSPRVSNNFLCLYRSSSWPSTAVNWKLLHNQQNNFIKNNENLYKDTKKKGFDELTGVIDEALDNVSSLTQDQALETSEKNHDKSIIPFVIEYNPYLPNIGLIIKQILGLIAAFT